MTAEPTEYSPTRRKSSIPPEEIARLRNLYAGHKVIAFPEGGSEQRGRMMSRESSSSKPRTRSLSAGRSRIRPNDLVQDVYDRLGVSRSTAAADLNFGLPVDDNTGVENTADFDFAAATSNFNPFSTSPKYSKTTSTAREDRNYTEDGAKKVKERYDSAQKFNERFVSAASRGRQAERGALKDSSPERRSRSLSRGRMAQRWPPARQELMLPTTESTTAAAVETTQSPTRSWKAAGSTTTASATAMTPTTPDPSMSTANTRSSLIRSETKRSRTYASSIPPSSMPSDPLYDDNNNNNTKNSKAMDGWKDEKKEPEVDSNKQDDSLDDQPPALHISPPSIKDRISAYGGKSGPKKKASHKNFTRSIDKQYAAHFAVREHPPKVDIYEGCGNSVGTDTDEKKEDHAGTNNNSNNNVDVTIHSCRSTSSETSVKSNEDVGNATVATSQTSPKPWSNAAAAAAASKKTPTQRSANNNKHRPARSGGRMAASFLAAIQQPQTSPKSKTGSKAPVTEISAVDRDEHFISGTDAQSLAMSSVSAEDYALRSPVADPVSKKSLWNDRQNRSARAHSIISSSSQGYQQSPVSGHKGFVAANTTNTNSNILRQDEIQRMIDERVQAQVSDMETKLGAQVRRWMQQMDDKMVMRMEAMENKIQRLQNTLDEIQSSREV